MFDNPTPIVAPLVATVGLLGMLWALRQPRSRRWIGPAADFWEYGRRLVLPLLNRLAHRHLDGDHYAVYELSEDEIVGKLDATPEEAEQLLWDAGGRRSPLAALKELPDGRVEVGSWAFRDGLLAPRKVHVILFRAEGGRALVGVHKEASPINPFTALDHYRGSGVDVDAGERDLRRRLDEGVWVEE